MLTPEQVGAIVKRRHDKLCEQLVDDIEGEIGREVTDPEYDRLSMHVEDKLAKALGELELS